MYRSELETNNIKFLLVANKIDAGSEFELKEKFRDLESIVFISAKNGLHLETLKERMVDVVLQGKVQAENTIVTNARHFHALQELHSSLLDVQKGLKEKLPGDLLALDIRRCLHYLGEITGEITNEDQLDYIFLSSVSESNCIMVCFGFFGRTTNNNNLYCVFLTFLFQTPSMSNPASLPLLCLPISRAIGDHAAK